jgi:hypothetical protein
MEIKVELLLLKKKQIDLLFELNNRGIRCSAQELSMALRGCPRPKFDKMRAMSEEIIKEWKAAVAT